MNTEAHVTASHTEVLGSFCTCQNCPSEGQFEPQLPGLRGGGASHDPSPLSLPLLPCSESGQVRSQGLSSVHQRSQG